MKHYLLFVNVLLFVLPQLSGQEQVAINHSAAYQISSGHAPKPAATSVAWYYRHHRNLPARYSGFLIELKKSELPLRRDHDLFRHFGGVYVDRLPKGGYSYGIKVDFSTRFEMKKYLKEVVMPKAADAKIIRYKNGNRR